VKGIKALKSSRKKTKKFFSEKKYQNLKGHFGLNSIAEF
jgi:hypothetical protein